MHISNEYFFFKCHHLGLKQHEFFFLKRVNLIILYVTYNIVIKYTTESFKNLKKDFSTKE